MSLLVTGSIGIDTVKTPFGTKENCLGGSSVYFAMAASFFTPVRFLGVIGDDCPYNLAEVFLGRNVDLAGLEIRKGSKTFRWAGSYQGAMNEASTDAVDLNVLAEDPPPLPVAYRDSQYVFLANTAPALQLKLLDQLDAPRLAVADTMNLWIDNARDDLIKLLPRVHGLVLNEGEARMLTGLDNLVAAADQILTLGPQFVVVKKGEHGALLITSAGQRFALPAYPTDSVKDPTGAGDTFAGGMMGHLAAHDASSDDPEALKQAIAHGTVAASLVIEDFSLNRWNSVSNGDIENRLQQLCDMVSF